MLKLYPFGRTGTKWAKRFLLCVSLSLSPVFTYANNITLPELGTAAGAVLPIEKERAMGDIMMRQIRASRPVVADPVMDEYLNTLGNRLVANASDVRFGFEFFWVNDPNINAFAFFGGHVGVHTGLIDSADNESQLASVLGHEIAHVTQRHIARRIQNARDNQAVTIATMITGILATIIAPDAGIAILSAGQTQSVLSQMTHSRAAEQESDRIGMKTMQAAGFDPRASAEFLTKLQAQVRYKQTPPTFILSHPLPDSRVSDVRLRAEQFPQQYVASSLSFYLAKARSKARYNKDAEVSRGEFEHTLKHSLNDREKTAARYGLAILALDEKNYAKAQEWLMPLLDNAPRNLFYLDVYADLKIAQKAFDEGAAYLSKQHALMPNNQVVTLNYAHLLLKADKLDDAEALLRDFLIEKPNHVLAKELLAQTYQARKDRAGYHEANAAVAAAYGAYAKAADEVQRALNHVTLTEELKQKRLKALLAHYREQQKVIANLKI